MLDSLTYCSSQIPLPDSASEVSFADWLMPSQQLIRTNCVGAAWFEYITVAATSTVFVIHGRSRDHSQVVMAEMCRVEKRGRVYLLTLTGTDEHRLNPALLDAIRSALAGVRSDAAASGGSAALVVAAEGKVFSPGFGLAWARVSLRPRPADGLRPATHHRRPPLLPHAHHRRRHRPRRCRRVLPRAEPRLRGHADRPGVPLHERDRHRGADHGEHHGRAEGQDRRPEDAPGLAAAGEEDDGGGSDGEGASRSVGGRGCGDSGGGGGDGGGTGGQELGRRGVRLDKEGGVS
ncbi:enoyl-CoA hydratase isomerase family protein [Musa troglodytarum]|uniref:Enoyl-CoA hydratase isomerase family protein n=1 Tax=Musa troglodytarum TaxID=320322 RepID=A0A9E7LD58_9LILI|nr:enoyl-CoA hydratase isomerase family protein [Musa troglodytarum]URE49176.1 enoyl-CoA hydratase isomerase family protein [Musa troglodytarum]